MWTFLLAAAVLWPGRVLSPLDGAPLNGQAEAVVIGIVLPVLWWLDGDFLARPVARAAIVALLALKLTTSVVLPQHGLCAHFSTTAPLSGEISTISIDEPAGILRSWDVRSGWSAAAPRCTAILDRAYKSRTEFPAAFLNILNAIRPDANDLALDVAGSVTVDRDGTFVAPPVSTMLVTNPSPDPLLRIWLTPVSVKVLA